MFCSCCEVDDQGTSVEIGHVPVLDDKSPAKESKAKTEVAEVAPAPAPKVAFASGIFTVDIPLPSSKTNSVGLELDAIDPKGPIVASIAAGLIKDFNDSNPGEAIAPYDRIDAVNGQTGEPAKLCEALTAAVEDASTRMISLRICRPTRFSATLKKTGEPLGTQLNFKVSSAGIVLSRVSPGGLVAKHNEQNPTNQILAGDRVGALNGSEMKGGAMVESLKKDSELKLTVYRYE